MNKISTPSTGFRLLGKGCLKNIKKNQVNCNYWKEDFKLVLAKIVRPDRKPNLGLWKPKNLNKMF